MSGASRQSYEGPRVSRRLTRRVDLRFFPASTGAPTFTAADYPWVNTVARTGVGEFLITMKDAHWAVVNAQATAQGNAFEQATVKDIVNTAGSPPTVEVQVSIAGVANDPAADANNSVFVELTFAESTS